MGASVTVPVDSARGSAWIADQLRQAIVEGTYKFGQKLPAERQLAEAFNASRTTVRLALDRLEMDKLVARRIGSGTFVSYRQPGETDDIAEITSPVELIEARLAIEPYMTRLAVLNASAKDLEKLVEACEMAEAAGNDPTRFTEWDTQFH
ncbi:MAG: GntR family transcriptional regulator, partial [Dongia sp.]